MNTVTTTPQDISKGRRNFNPRGIINDTSMISHQKEASKERIPVARTILEREVALEISKSLFSSCSLEMIEICKDYCCTKFTTQIEDLSTLAEGQVGLRSIYLSKYGEKLTGFEFNNDAPFKRSFQAKYHIRQGSRRDQVIIHFPAFVPEQSLKSPREATNFKIRARLIALSDFRFDTFERAYKSLNAELHGKHSAYSSGMLPLLKIPLYPMTSQLCLNQGSLLKNISLFLVMSISFYAHVCGRFVHLSEDGCMQIKQVF